MVDFAPVHLWPRAAEGHRSRAAVQNAQAGADTPSRKDRERSVGRYWGAELGEQTGGEKGQRCEGGRGSEPEHVDSEPLEPARPRGGRICAAGSPVEEMGPTVHAG